MNVNAQIREIGVSILGAVVGGVLGFYAYDWMLNYFMKAPMLPGACIGLGAGLFARRTSPLRAILCAIAGLALGIYAEWHFFPFVADDSFGYFLTHLHQLPLPTWLFLLLGALLSFWLAYGRNLARPT